MNIFIDTSPLKALVTPKDQWYTKTHRLIQIINHERHTLITTDYVLSETFTLLLGAKKTEQFRIQEIDRFIFKSDAIRIEWITKERFYKTKKLFLKVSKDKKWSFTDCASYLVMKELGIKTAFTFDIHFTQMGFKLLGE